MSRTFHRCASFTLVEILITVGVIAVLAAAVLPTISGVPEAAKKKKLEQDVALVNSAIGAYIAAGGAPENLNSGNVLSVLKSRVNAGVAAEMMGPQGPFLPADVVTATPDFGWSAVFSSDTYPRFAVVSGDAGVVFARGTASGGGDDTGVPASGPEWLWTYAEVTPGADAEDTYAPDTIESAGPVFGITPAVPVTALKPPQINAPGVFNLGEPPLVSLSNPNGSGTSRLVYNAPGGSGLSNYEDAFVLTAPGEITARAISLDPSRYANSAVTNATVLARAKLEVLAPGSIKYADLGTTNITVISSAEGTPYESAIRIQYEFDQPPDENTTNIYTAPIPLTAALWSNSSTITFQVTANPITTNQYLTDSELVPHPIAAEPEKLAAPGITPSGQIVFGSIAVTIATNASHPPGTRIYYTYTTDASAVPAPETGLLYTGPFVVSEFGVNEVKYVRAQAYPPDDLPEFWFEPSELVSETYQGLNFDYYNLEGVLVGGGNIANNAALNGSVVLVSVDGQQPSVTFNNNSVLTGDIYAPGTPTVTGISPGRVIDLDGDVNPNDYTINILKADFFGNVYRRITPVTMPVVELPTGLTEYTNTVSSGTLSPGHYSNVDPGNGDTITIGVPGATEPSVYVFDQFDTGNKFTMNVVGPVILTLDPGAGVNISLGNNVVLGNDDHPEWLQVNMFTGNITVGNGSAMYGSILNPNGTVSFQQNAAFEGGVTAKYINIENNAVGVTFSLPPPS